MTNPWLGGALMAVLLSVTPALAQKTVVGVTDTEIKIGQSAAFSGPASVYGQISTAESDYFKMINEQGGINGRKINLIALDDGYSPPKSIEVVRRLIEGEQVAILFQTIGTAPNAAIRKYFNQKKFPTSGSVLAPRCSLLTRRNIPGAFRSNPVTGWKGRCTQIHSGKEADRENRYPVSE